ncbi:hypothetical protein VRU48_05010 [Pedobacter sp. KR3-3]|uniref:Restriction endonuclease n=1 Tax=Pedobacter albus TaxID=3113905 RepID=A0ABU7I4R3_9SPHI|nr:hypothetical protein [Pedobacter sp. KR3-3]MEE1944457.1 hypothetical protein [Pedobacter sp. KR3-3]
MLKISEHFEYYYSNHINMLSQLHNWESYYELEDKVHAIFFDTEKQYVCVSLELSKENGEHQCSITSSYYIGLDRFSKLKLPVYIQPKLNNEDYQLNYIEMLLEALKEPENFDYLEGLVLVKFNDPWIEIENELSPELTPFLIAQFLATVKSLLKNGLKKSYYHKTENLSSRVKGKVLVGRQIKENVLKNKLTQTICQYQEFGFDTEANQFLKYVLSLLPHHFDNFDTKGSIRLNLEEVWRFCQAGFQHIGKRTFTKLQYKENNPFYKLYNLAIQLGNQILALYDYNIARNAKQATCMHPPFWIDMSKLFELYVFKKLREKFKGDHAVVYHQKYHKQELDFIINADGFKAVVDAKYKPRYAYGNPSMEDARQLSGYTRLKKVYEELGIDEDCIIPAYFVYPSNLPVIVEKAEKIENFEKADVSPEKLFSDDLRISTMYKKMYLQAIELPIQS